MSDPLLTVDDLSVIFLNQKYNIVIDSVDFTISRGETVALLGESGCGKTMTAKAFMQLLPMNAFVKKESQIIFDRQNLLELPEVSLRKLRGTKIAQIFQEPMTSLNPVLTVAEQIDESLQAHTTLNKTERYTRILELLNEVGIPEPKRRMYEYPHQLSGGMKQRIVIAMAIAGNPDLLIADEPTTALDVTIQAQILELLKKIQEKKGMSILLITHDLGVVSGFANRLLVMYAGKIVEKADTKEFFIHPKHPYSEQLLKSVPTLEKRDQPLATIPGFVPSIYEGFKGCRFAQRCQYSKTVCKDITPLWIETNKNEGVLCHRFDKQYFNLFTENPNIKHKKEARIHKKKDTLEPILKVNKLKIYYPIRKGLFKRIVSHVKAVDNVSFEIKKGQTLALVGESGCGKTSLGKGLLKLVDRTSGEVIFLSNDQLSMQCIFQDPFSSMNPRMLVGDIIAEGFKKDKNNKSEAIDNLLEQVGLSIESKDRYPHEFSGGQRQRICIARALAREPSLIICDEPTSALDVSVQAQILNLLKNLQYKLGISYLFITHNLAVVAYLADNVAVMNNGKIVEYGDINKIMTQPEHPYTKKLLASIPHF